MQNLLRRKKKKKMVTINDLYEIADKESVEIIDFDLSPVMAVSHMDEHGDCYIGIDYKILPKDTKTEKMVLAHELGHCVKGAFYNRYSKFDIRGRHEYRADKWAIENLMPKSEMENAMKQGYIEVWQLAEYFDVSEEMVKKALFIYFDNQNFL